MESISTIFLITGGILSFCISVLHVGIIYAGAKAYRYFGAGEKMAQMAESGSRRPGIITSGIASVFLIFSIYAFSAVNLIPELPYIKMVLPVIGGLYLLRGSALLYQIITLLIFKKPVEFKDIIFSLVSLLLGIIYFTGIILK